MIGDYCGISWIFYQNGKFFNSEIVGKPAPDSPFAVLFPQQSMEYGEIVPRYPTPVV